METKTIQHPLRTISFEYDETIPWTTQDEALLNSYLHVHNMQVLIRENVEVLFHKYAVHDKHVEELRKELVLVKEKVACAQQSADRLLDNITLRKQNVVEDFIEAVNTTSDYIDEYHKQMEVLKEECDELNAVLKEIMDDEENDKVWEIFSDVKSEHFQNYEINAIDIVSFDKEDDKFRGFASFHRDRNGDRIDYCNRAVENYNKLLLEITAVYEVWTEFGKRMVLIQRILDNAYGITTIHMN
ncbi:MAG: hypothetical protein WBP45_01345 [Daejeonella sp.]